MHTLIDWNPHEDIEYITTLLKHTTLDQALTSVINITDP